MRVLHAIETASRLGGGLPAAVEALRASQEAAGVRTDLLTYESGNAADAPRAEGSSAVRLVPSRYVSLSATRSARHWASRLDALSPDVCHVHGIWNPNAVFVVLAAGRMGIPVVVSPHGQLMPRLLAADGLPRRLKKLVYSETAVSHVLARRARLLHAVNRGEAEELCRRWPHKQVVTIHNLLDRSFFEEREAGTEGNRVRTNTILFLGRVERRKGVAELVRAFVAADLPTGWRLRVVGPQEDPQLVKWIEGEARAAGEGRRIEVLPPVTGGDRLRLFRECDVVCLPSRSEAIGLVNIEAALMGRLVVTTPEAGVDGLEQAGGFVCGSDPRELASVLERVARVDDREDFERSQALRAWALKEFHPDAIIHQWMDVLSRLAASGGER